MPLMSTRHAQIAAGVLLPERAETGQGVYPYLTANESLRSGQWVLNDFDFMSRVHC